MRWLLLLAAVLMAGCSTTREITFSAVPADAQLNVDSVPVGRGPVLQKVTFHGSDDVHTFGAARKGFKDQTVELKRDDERVVYTIALKPQSKKLTFGVLPVPAMVTVDGQPLSKDFTRQIAAELEFTVDAKDNWTTHKVRAERPNFAPAEVVVNFNDPKSTYVLNLEPLRKTMTIASNPAGATISVDGDPLGKSPATDPSRAFAFDVEAGAFQPHTIRAVKAGYDPVEKTIGWDDGKTDYTIDLLAKNKTVQIVTDPANCSVEIDGTKVPVDPGSGVATAKLDFPPINDQGDLKTYTAVISKKTADSEWTPQKLAVGWDNGRTDYSVVLKEILTKPVPLIIADAQRTDGGWTFTPKTISTLAWKDVTEGNKRQSPSQLTRQKGVSIDTIAVSPDGSSVLFTILIVGTEKNDFRSQMMLVKTDGTGGQTYVSDGKSLDITPSFTPDGSQIVFSSNRAGRRLSIWQMSAADAPGITQLTSGDTNDLWPSIDSDPKPRMYYQSLVDTRPDARLYMTQLNSPFRSDLQSGFQPRVSPKADSVVFTAINERSGKRDLYIMSDKGGTPKNLTNTPDIDEFDPAWNKDGSQIAFASDRGIDADKNHNYDIWTMDVTKGDPPQQITNNGSWDDCPAWDNTGENIYFRSNRGGDWNVWKAPAK